MQCSALFRARFRCEPPPLERESQGLSISRFAKQRVLTDPRSAHSQTPPPAQKSARLSVRNRQKTRWPVWTVQRDERLRSGKYALRTCAALRARHRRRLRVSGSELNFNSLPPHQTQRCALFRARIGSEPPPLERESQGLSISRFAKQRVSSERHDLTPRSAPSPTVGSPFRAPWHVCIAARLVSLARLTSGVGGSRASHVRPAAQWAGLIRTRPSEPAREGKAELEDLATFAKFAERSMMPGEMGRGGVGGHHARQAGACGGSTSCKRPASSGDWWLWPSPRCASSLSAS